MRQKIYMQTQSIPNFIFFISVVIFRLKLKKKKLGPKKLDTRKFCAKEKYWSQKTLLLKRLFCPKSVGQNV